jgi:ethanolamine ammonia-lyase small subunit
MRRKRSCKPNWLRPQRRMIAQLSVPPARHRRRLTICIGERPGLTAPDSMAVYLTWQPRSQTTDADRNCISNIRPESTGYADAAFKLRSMRARRLSGIQLKDESDWLLINAPRRE